LVAAAALVSFAPWQAFAGKREAKQLFQRGQAAYDAQRFGEAIVLFERAYTEHPAPEFLFNIAQAHRRLGHCEEALVNYRRFLEQSPETRVRREVEGHIARLRSECIEPEGPQPPAPPHPPEEEPKPQAAVTATATKTETPPSPPPQPPPVVVAAAQPEPAASSTQLLIAAGGGFAFPFARSYSIPAQLALELEGGPVFGSTDLRFEPLLRAATSAIPYESESSNGTVRVIELGVSLGGSYRATSAIALRAAIGGGLELASGLEPGNPLVADHAARSAAIMPAIRAAIGARIAIAGGLFAQADASYGMSFAPGDFTDSVLSRLALIAGAGVEL
jgi:hypothetical protein